ncbi:MAG TPA: bifunctional glutamate N-acetyltransferase/amino-acid acetyltransferase ArgJ [Abditibacterium sp.]|jgi:glutamate N-acetyltransferase/amino-acid N-acetyltransferase
MNSQVQWLKGRGITAPQGFSAGAARGEIKTEGDDVALVLASENATAAAVFTTNQVKAAPVLVSAEHLATGKARAIVVNAGNANCCTGARGLENARQMANLAAQKLVIGPDAVLVCSTGIIGHQLPLEKVENAISEIEMGRDDEKTARAFMTTDLVPKFCAVSLEIGGKTVTVGGQAKGVGMIGPNLAPLTLHATMLAFLTTDAQIERELLQKLLERAVARSFNSVTVDGDTSTNDTAILLASGESGCAINAGNAALFSVLLDAVCVELSKKIARDGEGATKLVEITVRGAKREADAQKIALTIANSPLVKTAIFGKDPNWGRIAMAAGRAGVEFDSHNLSFSLGNIEMFRAGEPVDFVLSEAEAVLESENVEITLDLGEGSANWTAWTCDFSYEYVKINAEYHT